MASKTVPAGIDDEMKVFSAERGGRDEELKSAVFPEDSVAFRLSGGDYAHFIVKSLDPEIDVFRIVKDFCGGLLAYGFLTDVREFGHRGHCLPILFGRSVL